MALTLTLSDLLTSAQWQDINAEIVGTGGNVVALAFTVNGAHALLSLGDGVDCDSTWNVSLDGATRLALGEASADDLPVTSDSDQTMMDACQWVRHAVEGAPVGDDYVHGLGCGH